MMLLVVAFEEEKYYSSKRLAGFGSSERASTLSFIQSRKMSTQNVKLNQIRFVQLNR